MNNSDVALVSISDVKKSPMKVFSMAKSANSPVYVLSRNKKIGVVLDIDAYNEMINTIEDIYASIDKRNEDLYQAKLLRRIQDDTGERHFNEAVLGENWQEGLDMVRDEWE